MNRKKTIYEFDPSGALAANRIVDEKHPITPVNGNDYFIIIPKFAPFFRKGLRVRHLTSGQPLTEGVHFDLGYKYNQASYECKTPVYGAIVLTDRTLSGVIEVTYQTLGGEFVLDDKEILTILQNIKNDPRTVYWDDIVNKPITFPPSDHLHHSDDLVGMREIEKGVYAIADAIGESAGKALRALFEHLADHANPHHVTLAQLGLDQFGSLAEATEIEVDTGEDGTHFISPRRLTYFLRNQVSTLLAVHSDNKNNPHDTTKEHVGLGEVPNFRVATITEAIEGKLNNRFMTPYLVAETVRDMVEAALATWQSENGTTKESLGLDLVPNYPLATREQAISGTDNTSLMSPLRTAQHTAFVIATAIQNHLDQPNPHNITAHTVGLEDVENYGVASVAELDSGVANNKYTTVAGVLHMIRKFSTTDTSAFDNHIADTNNPHNVTKEQVQLGNVPNWGIVNYSDLESDTVPSEGLVRPDDFVRYVKGVVVESGKGGLEELNEHIQDKENPHEVTAEQVQLGNVPNWGVVEPGVLAGTDVPMTGFVRPKDLVDYIADVADVTERNVTKVIDKHTSNKENPHGTTKVHVGLANVPNYPPASEQEVLEGVGERLVTSDVANSVIPRIIKNEIGKTKTSGVVVTDTTSNIGMSVAPLVDTAYNVVTTQRELHGTLSPKESALDFIANGYGFSTSPDNDAVFSVASGNRIQVDTTLPAAEQIAPLQGVSLRNYTFNELALQVKFHNVKSGYCGVIIGQVWVSELQRYDTLVAVRSIGNHQWGLVMNPGQGEDGGEAVVHVKPFDVTDPEAFSPVISVRLVDNKITIQTNTDTDELDDTHDITLDINELEPEVSAMFDFLHPGIAFQNITGGQAEFIHGGFNPRPVLNTLDRKVLEYDFEKKEFVESTETTYTENLLNKAFIFNERLGKLWINLGDAGLMLIGDTHKMVERVPTTSDTSDLSINGTGHPLSPMTATIKVPYQGDFIATGDVRSLKDKPNEEVGSNG